MTSEAETRVRAPVAQRRHASDSDARKRDTTGAATTLTHLNVFFCGSGLHYLISERIMATAAEGRNVLFYYRPFVADVVDASRWDRCQYLPWPRFDPLPGAFGKWRRLLENLRQLDGLPDTVRHIRLYAPVIDAEVVNYFINFLRLRNPQAQVRVSLIPDGLLNIQRNPLKIGKRINQRAQQLRCLISPQLRYYVFSGDRTGAEAAIVDEIWVMPGVPHEYPPHKTRVLPPLAEAAASAEAASRRALVLSQPLLQHGLMSELGVAEVSATIGAMLKQEGVEEVWYKAHPRDKQDLFFQDGYRRLELQEPLETHIARTPYTVVVGVTTTTLLLARGLCPGAKVVAVGLEHMRFADAQAEEKTRRAFAAAGVEVIPAS